MRKYKSKVVTSGGDLNINALEGTEGVMVSLKDEHGVWFTDFATWEDFKS